MIELLEHNKETYKRLCDVLEDNNKCALVQATGTGKSYIAGKYIEEHANTALILVPTNAIADAWSDLSRGTEKEVEIITYQAFAREPHNFLDYDLVIADEMHHLGSDVWGKKFVETYLQSENHKIIGLTATEIRYLDNSRDMAEEIFENIRVDGCDLPTAINTGVLPTFKYVSALYCDESDFDEWKEKAGKIKDIKTQTELKGRLDVCIKNMVSVKQAVNENLTDDYKKIIVFLNNVESKQTALEMFKDVFPTANFYDVDYSKSRTENNSQISQFKADENRAALFAVDMLNEGIHIKGTDCVIMFRKTVSPQVYLQQLGRGLASGTDKMPVIFDFVANTDNINRKFGFEIEQGIIRTWNDLIEDDKKILFKSYCFEIEKLFFKIRELTGRKEWTEEEERYILENYKIKNISEISEGLQRNISSVHAKMIDMGIYTALFKRWTKEEDLFLKENKGKMSTEEMAEILGRSYYATSSRISNMNQKNGRIQKKWSSYEDKFILDNYKNMTQEEMANKLGRTRNSVHMRVAVLGLSIGIGSYTKNEDNYIKENYKNISVSEIAQKLGRTNIAITQRARKLGVSFTGYKVVQLSISGEYITTYKSLSEASRKIQKDTGGSNIGLCAKGKLSTAYGFKWMYEEDYKKMIAEQKAGKA